MEVPQSVQSGLVSGDLDPSRESSEEPPRWVEEILRTHTARVRDVELLSGLDFYRTLALPYTNTLALKTYLHTFEENV
ncbi:Ectonucleotide pyrophosphatase/phosphodiesterase family member 2 [Bagarius yarrelli]|uniref:Ectonucleotide pyrophosphatase/phosphodiesterase family member 2 n=1 Tax=Bagarius yarrelli TaxID=175774 RepID=A0A556UYZ3_BAGYA|nr:Ectonucleotide pyrophosphatase/phosphodiesterase family member 2 [Bagarius yarrelli]